METFFLGSNYVFSKVQVNLLLNCYLQNRNGIKMYRRQESAKQKYVENMRRSAIMLNEHYENEDEISVKKPKRKATKTDQQPKVKRSKKMPLTPESESKSENDSEHELMKRAPEEQTLETNFMDMNDDCIHEILAYLKSKDLCALSTQCRRLQDLAKGELDRHFPNISEQIDSFEKNGYWFRFPDANEFIVCFAQFRKLSISNALSNAQSIANLKEFIKAKEKSVVKKIHFESCRNIRPSHGKALAELIDKTKSITFKRCQIMGEFHDAILSYFPSMENLVLWNSLEMTCEEDDETNWLKFEYPNLKSFSWFLHEEISISDEMKMFFKQNKSIKHFSLFTERIETLEKCAVAGIKITHLYYQITHNVETILEYLEKLCHKEKSLRFHLLFEDECRTELTASLKSFRELKNNLQGLYFGGLEPSLKLAKAIGQCIQLKNLQVQHCKHVGHFAALPKLENVYMSRGIVRGTSHQILNTMFHFATRAPKLKNLFFRNSCTPFREFNFDKYNAERAKLPGATRMTFHVRTKAKERINELSRIPLYDMFNFKRIDREDLANPLVNDWLYAH